MISWGFAVDLNHYASEFHDNVIFFLHRVYADYSTSLKESVTSDIYSLNRYA